MKELRSTSSIGQVETMVIDADVKNHARTDRPDMMLSVVRPAGRFLHMSSVKAVRITPEARVAKASWSTK